MGSRFRFFGAGVAVSALCFLLAAMSWPYVLGLFVLASISWGLWSWLAELEKEREKWRQERLERKEANKTSKQKVDNMQLLEQQSLRKRSASQSGRRQSGKRSTGKVYQFPVRNQDIFDRSEAAD